MPSRTQTQSEALDELSSGRRGYARNLLTTIASTVVTVLALVLGLTVVALQLSSTQFSPRLLRNFLRDRATQRVLSVFVATFAYSAAGLYTVGVSQGSRIEEFPRLAVSGAILLLFATLGMVVYFADHLAHSIQIDVGYLVRCHRSPGSRFQARLARRVGLVEHHRDPEQHQRCADHQRHCHQRGPIGRLGNSSRRLNQVRSQLWIRMARLCGKHGKRKPSLMLSTVKTAHPARADAIADWPISQAAGRVSERAVAISPVIVTSMARAVASGRRRRSSDSARRQARPRDPGRGVPMQQTGRAEDGSTHKQAATAQRLVQHDLQERACHDCRRRGHLALAQGSAPSWSVAGSGLALTLASGWGADTTRC